MVSDFQSPASTNWQLSARRLMGYATICLVSLASFSTLHEATHLTVGRLLGIPAVFISPTSVGVSPEIAAHTSPTSLAWMNGVAPVETVLLGLLMLMILPRLKHRMPDIATRFFAWWAIFGVPYLGLQMMLTGAPIEVRGIGSDFAAVAGYFGLPSRLCALIAILGLIFFCVSSFWLRVVVATTDNEPFIRQLRPADLHSVPSRIRRYLALLLAALFIVLAILSTIQIMQGNHNGVTILAYLCAIILWPVIIALLIPWSAPGARIVRNNWLLPGIVAGVFLFIFGTLTESDYSVIAIMLPSLLVASAWAQASRTSN